MSDVLKFRGLAEVEEEAAAWVWRLDDEQVLEQTRDDFERWLQRDARHRRAFEELGGVWRSLDDLAEAKREERVATFVAEERRLLEPPSKARRGRLRRWAPWAVAASLALTVGMVFWLQRGNETQTLATAVGQQRSATLGDGSIVQLNTNTIVETRFTGNQRMVYLRKGEATFKVAKDRKRPFFVHAGDMVVRAVGTEFNVRLRENRDVEVIVTEGKVEVKAQANAVAQAKGESSSGDAGATSKRASALVAGQRFEAAATTAVAQITPAAVSSTLAWREGAVVFDGEPLVQAIAELNRYSDTRLVVADSSIYGLRVGGRFRTGDVEGFLEALTKAFPVTTRRTTDHVVYIQARAAIPSTHH